MNERKVNLFVVGAMKAGTTSLASLFSTHPDIYCPPVKEPHFFVDYMPETLYEPGRFFDLEQYLETKFPEPLHIAKVTEQAQYDRIFSLAGEEKYLADFSTAYLHAPGSPEHIQKYNPDAHIIIILRDPLKRAHSHYKMDIGKGRTTATFQQALEKELAAYEQGELPWYSYLGMSFYQDAVKNYRGRFKQVHVIRFEHLISKTEEVLDELTEFLQIAPFEQTVISYANTARKPRLQRLYAALKRVGVKDYFSAIFGSKFKQRAYRALSRSETDPLELSPEIEARTKSIFQIESYL